MNNPELYVVARWTGEHLEFQGCASVLPTSKFNAARTFSDETEAQDLVEMLNNERSKNPAADGGRWYVKTYEDARHSSIDD